MWRNLSTALDGHLRMPIESHPKLNADAVTASVEESADGLMPVPDLTGITVHDARRLARVTGLGIEIEERSTTESLVGQVLAQHPAPGVMLPLADSITLVVGAKPHVAMPRLGGRDEAEALELLREAGLAAARRLVRRSNSVPEGHIIRTRPRAGTELPAGSRVAYVVSSGPKVNIHDARRGRQRVRVGRMPDGSFLSLPDDRR